METVYAGQDQLRRMLRKLGFAPHHAGYKLLIDAVYLYLQDSCQSATKELYPALARQNHMHSAASIERSIRYAISEAWDHGSRVEWDRLFPRHEKAPSNLAFIATMADLME